MGKLKKDTLSTLSFHHYFGTSWPKSNFKIHSSTVFTINLHPFETFLVTLVSDVDQHLKNQWTILLWTMT